jgi:hypothetical protein
VADLGDSENSDMPDSLSQMRLRFDKAEFIEDPDGTHRAVVTVSFATQVIQTEARIPAGELPGLRDAALATLTAIEQATENRFVARLADLDHVNALGKDLIAVLIDIRFEGKEVQVFGSCQIGSSEIDAAAKAVLNATNRFVELSTRK